METLKINEQQLFGLMLNNAVIEKELDQYFITFKDENTLFSIWVVITGQINKIEYVVNGINSLNKKLEYRIAKSKFIKDKITEILK